MSEFNPALVILANIYADAFSNRQTTEVYANGVMQVSIFVSVNYNGNADEIENEIKNYVRDNVVIYRLGESGDKEEVDWVYSDTSNGFPHDIEYHGDGGKASDIRTPLYFTVPPDSVGKHRWIAKLGERETNPNTPVTINAQKFQPLADGSQFEIAKRVNRDNDSLCVIRYKAGAFPGTQRLMKAYKYKGTKFTSTGGNSWLSKYQVLGSAVFVEYKDNNIKLAEKGKKYEEGEYESDQFHGVSLLPFGEDWNRPTRFSKSELEAAWMDGVVVVQCSTLILLVIDEVMLDSPFGPDTFELQDNFGNIIKIEIDLDWEEGKPWDEWEIKSAIVLYP